MLQAAQLSCLHSGREGALRYRQIEYHRMPLMTYLAFDDPRELARNEFIRRRRERRHADYAERHVADFEH